MTPILFSLDYCNKCIKAKELLRNNDIDFKSISLPHIVTEWSFDQRQLATEYDVLDDLSLTAPVLISDDKKYLGYLKIKQWISQTKNIKNKGMMNAE